MPSHCSRVHIVEHLIRGHQRLDHGSDDHPVVDHGRFAGRYGFSWPRHWLWRKEQPLRPSQINELDWGDDPDCDSQASGQGVWFTYGDRAPDAVNTLPDGCPNHAGASREEALSSRLECDIIVLKDDEFFCGMLFCYVRATGSEHPGIYSEPR